MQQYSKEVYEEYLNEKKAKREAQRKQREKEKLEREEKKTESEIPSPIVDKADVVIALNDASQIKFEKKVKKGGFMIINSSLAHIPTTRTDINYIKIPFNDLAQKLTQPAFVNVMALGAFIEKTGILKLDSIIEVMKEMSKTVSAKKAALLPNNIECVKFGAEIIKNQLVTV